jgi:hypothetical protein
MDCGNRKPFLRSRGATLCATVLVALLAVSAIAAAPPLQLPQLLRIASKLTGLKAKKSIRVTEQNAAAMRATTIKVFDREYPLDQQAYDQTLYRALGMLTPTQTLRPFLLKSIKEGPLGLYDPLKQRIYVRKGTSEKTAVVHELVHALQDQAFNLKRLSGLRRGRRDAALGAAAAVEGNASYVTQVLGGRSIALVRHPADARTLAASLTCRMCFFLDIEMSFPYVTGLNFMNTLYSLGARPAMYTAVKKFPATTKQIFHVDAFLTREPPAAVALPQTTAAFTLQRSDTWGELDVRALLAVFDVPRLDQVGTGWSGGRSALYVDASGRQAAALALTWETELDAQQWQEAVSTYVNEAFDGARPGFPPATACAATTCWDVGGRVIAFARTGATTSLVFGATVDDAAALAQALAPAA